MIISALLVATISNSFAYAASRVEINQDKLITSPISISNEKETLTISTDSISSDSAVISWKSDNVLGCYSIYKYNYISNTWDKFKDTYTNKLSIKDLSSATLYKFQVRSQNSSPMTMSEEDILGEVVFCTLPESPKLEKNKITENSVSLKWTSNNMYAFEIYRKTNNSQYALIDKVEGSEREYKDVKLKSNTVYNYVVKSVYKGNGEEIRSEYSNIIECKTSKKPVSMNTPNVSGTCKTYAYYTAVTNKSSAAYAVLNSGTYNGKSYKTHTDEKTGIRMVDDCYCAALGTYYGTTKGTKYKVTLSSGNTFNIILCDSKSNRHTDSSHRYAIKNQDVIEFYVERGKIPSSVNGNYNSLSEFKGSIVSIEKI